MAVLDVAVGEHGGGAERVVGDRAAVVRLVAVAETAQDLHGVVHGRLVDADLLEAALEGGVALEVLAVLVERRRADRLQLAAGQRRLEDGGRVDRALRGAGADEVVELVDEENDVAALGDLLHHLLQALLELAAVLRARHERGQVERVDLLVLQELGHLVRGDARREALDDGGLADARLADQHRIVLRSAREDLHHALDLGLAPDDGVELALGRQLGQVAAELVEELRALGLLARGRGAALLPTAGAGEHADDLVADLLGVGVEVEQDACRDALVLAHEPEQDVLGADVVVAEGEGLAQRQLQHLLRARRERDLARRHLVALADDPGDLGPNLLHRDVEALEHAGGEPLLLAEEPEQDVLGADVVVLEGAGLVLGEDDDLPGSLGEALEQASESFPARQPDLWYRTCPGCPRASWSPYRLCDEGFREAIFAAPHGSFGVPPSGDARARASVDRWTMRRRLSPVLVAALAFLALAAPTPAGAQTMSDRDSLEDALVSRINTVRRSHGLRQLSVVSRLDEAADGHATSMAAASYFRHELYTPTRATTWTAFSTWIRWHWPGPGYSSWSAGENLAWGAPEHLRFGDDEPVAGEPRPPREHPQSRLAQHRRRRRPRPRPARLLRLLGRRHHRRGRVRRAPLAAPLPGGQQDRLVDSSSIRRLVVER